MEPPCDTLFVGSLDLTVDEGVLFHAFSQFGEVAKVTLIKDKMTGESRGFAYIAFFDPRAAEEARHIDGQHFNSRRLKVEFAVSEPGGGRFGPTRGVFARPPLRGRGGPPPFARGRAIIHPFAHDVDIPPFPRGGPPMRGVMRGGPGPLMQRGGRGYIGGASPPSRGRYPLPAPPPRESPIAKVEPTREKRSEVPASNTATKKSDNSVSSSRETSSTTTVTTSTAVSAQKTNAKAAPAQTPDIKGTEQSSNSSSNKTKIPSNDKSKPSAAKDQPPAKKPALGDGLLPTPGTGKAPVMETAKDTSTFHKRPAYSSERKIESSSRPSDTANHASASSYKGSKYNERQRDERPPPRFGHDDRKSSTASRTSTSGGLQPRAGAPYSRDRGADSRGDNFSSSRGEPDRIHTPPVRPRHSDVTDRHGSRNDPPGRDAPSPRDRRDDRNANRGGLDSRGAPFHKSRDDAPPPQRWTGQDRYGPDARGKDSPYRSSPRREQFSHPRDPDNRPPHAAADSHRYADERRRDAAYDGKQLDDRYSRSYPPQGRMDLDRDRVAAVEERYDSHSTPGRGSSDRPIPYDSKGAREERDYTDRREPLPAYGRDSYPHAEAHGREDYAPRRNDQPYEERSTYGRDERQPHYDDYRDDRRQPEFDRRSDARDAGYDDGYARGGRLDSHQHDSRSGYPPADVQPRYDPPAGERHGYSDQRDHRDDYRSDRAYADTDLRSGRSRSDYPPRENESSYSDRDYTRSRSPYGSAPATQGRVDPPKEYAKGYGYRDTDPHADPWSYKEERSFKDDRMGYASSPGVQKPRLYPGSESSQAGRERSYPARSNDRYDAQYADERSYESKDAYASGGPSAAYSGYRSEAKVTPGFESRDVVYPPSASAAGSYMNAPSVDPSYPSKDAKAADRSFQSPLERGYGTQAPIRAYDKPSAQGTSLSTYSSGSRSFGDSADRGYVGYGSGNSGADANKAIPGESYKTTPGSHKEGQAADRSSLPSSSAFDQLYSIAAGALSAKDFSFAAGSSEANKSSYFGGKPADGDKGFSKGRAW